MTVDPLPLTVQPEPAPQGGRWFGIAIGLVVGLLIGFAGGFIVAQRNEPIAPPRSAAEPAIASPPPAARFEPSAAAQPAAGAPQTFTESPVAEPSAPATAGEETPVTIDAPNPAPAAAARAERPRAESARPVRGAAAPRTSSAPVERAVAQVGSLQVVSRPSGAQVYLDDVRVGTTPMTLGMVSEGRHRVRLDLPGYRPWTTSVDVTGDNPTRIGASLER